MTSRSGAALTQIEVASLLEQLAGRELDEAKVEGFVGLLDGLPPIVVFDTPQGLLLVDGYHRVAAARRAGRTAINAEITVGSRHEALRWAVANAAAERGISEAEALENVKRRAVGWNDPASPS
jgi:hypothetical protein